MGYIHAGLVQDKRTRIFENFKRGKVRFMIATDVAGRGLDFSKVTHVINMDFPDSEESYTHRTGRVGRMGKEGSAITLITKRELTSFESLIRKKKIVPHWIGKNPLD